MKINDNLRFQRVFDIRRYHPIHIYYIRDLKIEKKMCRVKAGRARRCTKNYQLVDGRVTVRKGYSKPRTPRKRVQNYVQSEKYILLIAGSTDIQPLYRP